MSFLPPLEMRPSSIAPNPVESREGPPNSRVLAAQEMQSQRLGEGHAEGRPAESPGANPVDNRGLLTPGPSTNVCGSQPPGQWDPISAAPGNNTTRLRHSPPYV